MRTETALIAAAKKGDRDAFGELYKQLHPEVCKALRVTVKTEYVDDVAQEAWLRAWLYLHSYRNESSFKTWVITIGIRIFFTELRRKQRLSVLASQSAALSDSGLLPSPVRSPFDSMVACEREERVASLMSCLSERESAVVHSYYFLGDKLTAIESGTSTVRVIVKRARDKMRKRIAADTRSLL